MEDVNQDYLSKRRKQLAVLRGQDLDGLNKLGDKVQVAKGFTLEIDVDEIEEEFETERLNLKSGLVMCDGSIFP